MNELSIMALLYRLGRWAERLSWWAYDQSSRYREEQVHRMALNKAAPPSQGYGFARPEHRLPIAATQTADGLRHPKTGDLAARAAALEASITASGLLGALQTSPAPPSLVIRPAALSAAPKPPLEVVDKMAVVESRQAARG